TAGAEEAFTRALSMDDRNAEAHYNLGVALLASPRDDRAIEDGLRHTQAALALRPDLIEARVNASKALLLLEPPAEAEAEARAALGIDPDFAPAQLNLAESLFREARYAEAAALFKELAVLDPANPDIRSPYIVSLIHTGDLASARLEAEGARRAFPQIGWFDFCLARVEARSGHQGEALAL